jgi:protein TonB
MRGVPAKVGGVPPHALPLRLPIVLTAILAFVLISARVGTAQSGAAQTQAAPSGSQTLTTPADELKALRQSADQGDAAAACQLGTIYEAGQAVPEDRVEAAKWFMLGSMLSGDLENNCAHKLDRLLKQMPADQLAEATKRMEKWRAAVRFTDPVLRKEVKPHYDEDAMRAKITGDVVLEVLIGIDGTPLQYRVVRSLDPRLDREAIKAVRRWRFAPARFGDRAVPMVVNVELPFSLRK